MIPSSWFNAESSAGLNASLSHDQKHHIQISYTSTKFLKFDNPAYYDSFMYIGKISFDKCHYFIEFFSVNHSFLANLKAHCNILQ